MATSKRFVITLMVSAASLAITVLILVILMLVGRAIGQGVGLALLIACTFFASFCGLLSAFPKPGHLREMATPFVFMWCASAAVWLLNFIVGGASLKTICQTWGEDEVDTRDCQNAAQSASSAWSYAAIFFIPLVASLVFAALFHWFGRTDPTALDDAQPQGFRARQAPSLATMGWLSLLLTIGIVLTVIGSIIAKNQKVGAAPLSLGLIAIALFAFMLFRTAWGPCRDQQNSEPAFSSLHLMEAAAGSSPVPTASPTPAEAHADMHAESSVNTAPAATPAMEEKVR